MDTSPPPKKLLDQLRDALRVKHYALSTENSYVEWADRFIRFHKMLHPKDMGETEIAASQSVIHHCAAGTPCSRSCWLPRSA